MTQEEKEILVKVLCCLIPYGVKVECAEQGTFTLEGVYKDSYGNYRVVTDCEEEGKCNNFPIEAIKPYVRPLHDMTEDELKEFQAFHCVDGYHPYFYQAMCNIPNMVNMFNWLMSHHFDCFGLLQNGLGIEASNGIYK